MPDKSIVLNYNTNVLPVNGLSHFATPSVKQSHHSFSLQNEYNNYKQGLNTHLRILHIRAPTYTGYTLKYVNDNTPAFGDMLDK
ncbi:hypothetical protein FHU42_003088 [Corynebacterium glutamicum]|nr:hypothetical protein [Corynebacterium glutamicum]